MLINIFFFIIKMMSKILQHLIKFPSYLCIVTHQILLLIRTHRMT